MLNLGTDWRNRNRTGRSGLCLKSRNVVHIWFFRLERPYISLTYSIQFVKNAELGLNEPTQRENTD